MGPAGDQENEILDPTLAVVINRYQECIVSFGML